MDPRRPLSNPAVYEEFVDLFYYDLSRRPALVEWLKANHPPAILRELQQSIDEDKMPQQGKLVTFGYPVDKRLKTLGKM